MFNVIFLMIISIIISSCSIIPFIYDHKINIIQIASAVVDLDLQYDKVVILLQSKKDKFTPEKYQALENVRVSLDAVRVSVKQLVKDQGSIQNAIIKGNEVIGIYMDAKKSYIIAKEVIIPELQLEYKTEGNSTVIVGYKLGISEQERIMLKVFDDNARKLDTNLKELQSTPNKDATNFVRDLIAVAASSVKLFEIMDQKGN